jgi:hypothetical protein
MIADFRKEYKKETVYRNNSVNEISKKQNLKIEKNPEYLNTKEQLIIFR